MASSSYHVVAIGNAIVDVLAHADDAFLGSHGLTKGAMTLIDEAAAHDLYGAMGSGIECSGGSAANTIAAIASLGGRGAYIGKVRDDQLGAIFQHDIQATGVAFNTAPATEGASTARCLILVTPDAERTMQTYLGVCSELSPADIDGDLIAGSEITYLEGYLWDQPAAKEAFIKAASLAHEAGRMVSLTLSDPFCVDRHREEFVQLVDDHVDVLFANEDEIKSLYQVTVFDDAVQAVRAHCRIAALTRSEKGSVVVSGDEVHVVDAARVDHVADTTGAGDAYAAGVLFGLTTERDLATSGRIGGMAAAEVISHMGARAETSLSTLLKKNLGT